MNDNVAERVEGVDPLKVELWPLKVLTPAKRNARTHSEKQIEQLAASIRQFGFLVPILVNSEGRIVAGHGRAEAAKRLRMEEVPVIPVEHLTEDELRAYALADNKLAENAGWDTSLLRIELQELQSLDLGFDIEITGFGTTEIDVLIDGKASSDEPEAMPGLEKGEVPVVALGDFWLLGDHRLYCGDALKRSSYEQLMGDERARMVFSDPPYNVKIDGHVCGLGNTKHAEFQMASGEMSSREFTAFLETAFQHQADFSIDGAIHFSSAWTGATSRR